MYRKRRNVRGRRRKLRAGTAAAGRRRAGRGGSRAVHVKRRVFSMAAWTASFIMVLNMIPADSPAAQAIAKYEASLPAMSLGLEELKNGSEDSAVPEDGRDAAGAGESSSAGEAAPDDAAAEIQVVSSDVAAVASDDGTAESEAAAADTPAAAAVLTNDTSDGEKLIKVSSATGSGDILIYHTHATEAYAPVANDETTHSTDAAGTVREAGANLAAALKAKGYNVIHDGTLHDSPSYNKSYNRSLETLKSLLASYPSPKLVIDFHRDAASSANGKARTAVVNGETVASFGLVVGTKNTNYKEIRALADKIVKKANELYPGLSTGVIEKSYKFNGYLSNNFILLELGNNANTIEQVNASVPYIADVIANVLG